MHYRFGHACANPNAPDCAAPIFISVIHRARKPRQSFHYLAAAVKRSYAVTKSREVIGGLRRVTMPPATTIIAAYSYQFRAGDTTQVTGPQVLRLDPARTIDQLLGNSG